MERYSLRHYFLILCILFGVFIRFYGLGSAFIIRDGVDFMIAGIKLHHNNPYDARLWNLEHPPVGKWFFGLPTRFIEANYEPTLRIPMNMYVWQYKAYEALEKTYVAMRGMSALFGSLSLLFIFLIAKELYRFESALWSTAIAALSFDLITYSRGDMADIYMVFFTLGTIFFYINYLKAKNETIKIRYLILTFAFFTLNLGTRSLQPLFLIPILLICQFLFYGTDSKFQLPFIVAMGFGLYLFLYVIYPPEIRELSLTFHHQVKSVLELLPPAFNFHGVTISLFIRNSYLFAAGVALLTWQLALMVQRPDLIKRIRSYLKKTKPESILVVFFTVGFFALGGMRYGDNIRYLTFVYLPLFALAGEQINKFRDKRIFFVLILVDIYGIISFLPNFSDYTNFGIKSYMIYDTSGGYDNFPRIRGTLSYLDSDGRPPIISNDPNILIFYKGKKTDIPIPAETKCNPTYFQNYKYIVYYPRANPNVDIQMDKYLCPYVHLLPLRIEKTFGAREDNPGIIIIYRIGS